MKNRFNEKDANAFVQKLSRYPRELALRIYTSRLIGMERSLVLHGGGNTSVKCKLKNIVGEQEHIMFVKGSGFDLATIEPEGFVGLRLEPLRKLRQLDALCDVEMENQLSIHRMRSSSANPSVEALLHAFLPHKYIDHTHADSILVLTNQKHGEQLIRSVFGPGVTVLPYTMSGFPLAKQVFAAWKENADAEAIVILHHGIFTFAETARQSYERMIDYVSRAEAYIKEKLSGRSLIRLSPDLMPSKPDELSIARAVQAIRGACARPLSGGRYQRLVADVRTASDLMQASVSEDVEALCLSGVLTPDHVIRTKHQMAFIREIPEQDDRLKETVRESVERFRADYLRYCEMHSRSKEYRVDESNPYPVLFLVSALGLVSLGTTPGAAKIAADIGEQTIRAKLRSFALGEYEPISEHHVFDMEFWGLQQKKLDRSDPLPLQGQIALVTGAAGAIGFAIADRLLAAGAVVAICDIDAMRLEKVAALLKEDHGSERVMSIVVDVTDLDSVKNAYTMISNRFGGIDIVVPNAGIAHVARIEDLDPDKLDRVLAVNLKGTFNTIKAAVPIFRRQGSGGNIVVISSKNVFDPGAAFGAYSASKAGAHQISKIAAIELAELGVRVNMINPDAVFGDERVSSRLWDEIGPDRMKSRGLDAAGLRDYYRKRSLLKVPVVGEHVGNAVVFFASELTPTTGASLPVDAGNPAAFPR
ncbi:MAG: bifunctional aldolase/short-chain dehydrogenase [Deltaproteobacteria bacterium]|nr:bifunctional aldolase/short-chain dehydrogenase [Deltaproteobacteria bacterium]